jgi:hypothetical protein
MRVSKCKCKFNRNVRRTGKVKAEIELTPKKEGNTRVYKKVPRLDL